MTDIITEQNIGSELLPFNPEDYSLKEVLNPKHSALLVVDMQNDFLSSKGFFATRPEIPGSVDQMQSTVPFIQGLMEAARKSHVPVILTKGYEDVKFRKPGPDLRRAVVWQERDGDPDGINSKQDSWGAEFYEGIEPVEGDIIVEKHKWSAFDGKDMDGKGLKEILERMGVKTLVVTGVVAETCIETTIRDGYDQDFFIVVPRNSIGSNQEDQLSVRMKYWEAGFLSDVVDEEVVKENWIIPENREEQVENSQ
ncbi:MAG: isochorismatase family cysteine hydrolase [Candidatus Daviesbacteria bacterium]|nr:isochorismatase family cysteine hydrolase [Candidatus Daviesbacteria bacterium]